MVEKLFALSNVGVPSQQHVTHFDVTLTLFVLVKYSVKYSTVE